MSLNISHCLHLSSCISGVYRGVATNSSQLEKRDYMQAAPVSNGLVKTKDATPVAHCKKKE